MKERRISKATRVAYYEKDWRKIYRSERRFRRYNPAWEQIHERPCMGSKPVIGCDLLDCGHSTRDMVS